MAGSDCERLGSGWLVQPANAVSCVAFLAAGCWLLMTARNGDGPRSLLLSGAVALMAVGVGSIAYHGPQPGWGDPLHSWSVNGLVIVVVGQTVYLLLGAAFKSVGAVWKAAGGWMVAGLIAYTAGRTGSRWCRPDSLWQWHAVWHVFIAGGVARLVVGYSSAMQKKAAVSG